MLWWVSYIAQQDTTKYIIGVLLAGIVRLTLRSTEMNDICWTDLNCLTLLGTSF